GKPPRTIEKEMADLHLGTRGYEGDLDTAILDELMARALGKLNRLFLKNEDGTAIPGVSFGISFTATKPEKLKTHEYWTALVAGAIMNVAEGAGLRETQACFIPAHAEILERLLGRYEEKKK